MFWQHCSRSMWDCFAQYNRLLQQSRRDVTVALIIFSAVGPSIYFLIFPTAYRLKLILLHNLAMCASRQHVESKITPKFLGGSLLGEIDWSPTLIDLSDILLSSSRVVMTRRINYQHHITKTYPTHIRTNNIYTKCMGTCCSCFSLTARGVNKILNAVTQRYCSYYAHIVDDIKWSTCNIIDKYLIALMIIPLIHVYCVPGEKCFWENRHTPVCI